MEIYEIIIQDEWNNLYEMGFYKDLDDALPDLNGFLSGYNVELEKGDIVVYPSTFDSCFDTNIGELLEARGVEPSEIDETLYSIYVRGFFFDGEELARHLIDLTTQIK